MATRRATPLERELLAVYRDAEHYLLVAGTRAVAKTVRGPAKTEAARQAAALRTLRAVTAQTVAALNRNTPGLIVAAIRAGARRGGLQAARQLTSRTGPRPSDLAVNLPAIDQLAATTVGRVRAAHEAILRTVPDAYRQAVARATPAVLVGTETRVQAAQRAWWDLTSQGITGFTDRAGRRWRLSSYVEMATRTAVNRAEIDGRHGVWAANGRDLVQVIGSADRCPKCRPWHAAILSITGNTSGTVAREHTTQDGVMVDVHVAASVEEARAAGWGHPACRCTTRVYMPGLAKPDRLDPDESGYEATQRQRAIERAIRHAKERVDTAIDPDAAQQAKAQVRAGQDRMRAHLDEHPHLLRYRDREQVGAGNIPSMQRRAQLADEKWADLPDLDRAAGRNRDDGDGDAARREREDVARRNAEEQARQEAAESLRRAKAEAERQAAVQRAAEEAARREAEAEQARREAERAAREAAEKARRAAERAAEQAARDAERARREAEEAARREAERKAAEEAARREAQEKARRDAERQAAEETARQEHARREAEQAATPETREARVEAHARTIDEAIANTIGATDLDQLGSLDRAGLRGHLEDPRHGQRLSDALDRLLRDAYPDAGERDLEQAHAVAWRHAVAAATHPADRGTPLGRGLRLALTALDRKTTVPDRPLRDVIGDIKDELDAHSIGRRGPDTDGGLHAGDEHQLELIRAAGAAVGREVDRLAEPGATREQLVELRRRALAQVRDMATPDDLRQRVEYGSGMDEAARARLAHLVDDAARSYPRAWVQNLGRPVTLTRTQPRGFYDPNSPDRRLEMGTADSQHVVTHEFGHAMEDARAVLRAVEWAYRRSRVTSGEPGRRRVDEQTTIYRGTDEVGYKDDFVTHYAGKTYGDGPTDFAEVFTIGMESLMAPDGRDYTDPDLEQLILGMLATL